MIAQDAERDRYPNLRDTYPVSGLYKKNGPAMPIWTIDWYAYDVVPASDGIHLVRPGRWAMRNDNLAVSFFANGKLIRQFRIDELVSFPKFMPHSVSHFTWIEKEEMDAAAKTYTITTKHLERYVFDVTTGNIVSSFSPFRIAALIGVAGLVWGFFILRRSRLKKGQMKSRA